MGNKGTHVIQKYNHSANIILCVCGWTGSGDEPWVEHKKWGKENPFKSPNDTPSLYRQMHSKKYRQISAQLIREAEVEAR